MTPSIQKQVEDEVQMWVELAVHKYHAKKGAVILGECSEESVKEILSLIETSCDRRAIEELELLLADFDMAEREPGDMKVHEYKDFDSIRDRIAELQAKLDKEKNDE